MEEYEVKKDIQTKVKEVEKNVLFYRIATDNPSLIKQEQRKADLKDIFDSKNVYFEKIIDGDNSVVISEISKDNNYFFGSICKTNDNIDPFTKMANKTDKAQIDLEDILFQHYTYFYIDYSNFVISCIISQSIQTADKIIESFLNNGNISNYAVVPLSKNLSQLEQTINTFKLSLSNVDDFIPMKSLNQLDCEVGSYKVEVKLNKVGNNFLQNFKDLVVSHKNKTTIARIGNGQDDFDLLKNVFSRKTKIKILSNYDEDLDSIRKILQSELIKTI